MARRNWLVIAAALPLALGLALPQAGAVQLDETAFFIEINDTDGDAGVQLFLDGDQWEVMQLIAPDGTVLLNIAGESSIAAQGLTELFFESAEPSFDEQTLDELLALFPEGRYKFRGVTTKGRPLRGRALLTHALPEAPVLVSPAEGEEVDPDEVVIEWMTVPDPPGSRIVKYEVVVEKDEGRLEVFKVDLGPRATRVTVPPEFMRGGFDYKYEVLAVEKSGNQTISEREFSTADD